MSKSVKIAFNLLLDLLSLGNFFVRTACKVRTHRSDTVLENLLNHGTDQNGLCEGE